MLEISLHPKHDDSRKGWLIVNGNLLDSSEGTRAQSGKLDAVVGNPECSGRLTCHRFVDLSQHFDNLDAALESRFPELRLALSLSFIESLPSTRIQFLRLVYHTSVQDWTGPWSIAAYDEALHEAWDRSGHKGFGFDLIEGYSEGTWAFDCYVRDIDNSVDDELCHWGEIASSVIASAREVLATEVDPNTLITFFDFPPGVSTACEQYLLYFVQFLQDLGIEANASIKHEARQVLFTVTPKEGAEALNRIQEALDIYLRLPDSPEFAAQAPAYDDIAVQQLQANIFHLKGQLAISGAVLQAKNAQIEALQLSNYTYQQLLTTQQRAGTLPLLPPGNSDTDTEPLVPGVIEVTKYEGKGFTVNFAEILRRLKRRFD